MSAITIQSINISLVTYIANNQEAKYVIHENTEKEWAKY